MKNSVACIFLLIIMLCQACEEQVNLDTDKQFYELAAEKSGIDFENKLEFRQDFNIYTYRNFYNGGGVGIADVNNDGFVDIYLTANMEKNKLYLNNGDLTFTDVTDKAGVGGEKSWSTGVSMVDINGDKLIDIYVCNSGDIEGDNKQNELFINQGDGTFTEEAKAYGLADNGFSTHAAFFDFDNDSDLDVYLLNNSFQAIGSFNLRKNQRPIRSEEGGDKLFRNDGGTFTDVSEEAGIYGSIIGFGLGVTVGDIDLDGWQDLYISNDFFERDYIYMNNGDGTFSEDLEQQMKSISGASMGADMADINNDGYPDIFVTEMLPEPHDRLKTKTTFENWDKYQYNLENGYYHQFTRNMLQLNNQNKSFSEIGRMAGVEATDWSWGALICDFDNDGHRDLFIANGIHKDLTDQDYINYISTEEMARKVISKDGVDFKTLTEVIPSNKISNYMYRNEGNLTFNNETSNWGLDKPSHSNGSAYADLDNDGDMDLVINNVNDVASVYINTNNKRQDHHYLKVILEGPDGNTQGIGAKVEVFQNDNYVYHEQVPVRGFQSSVDPRAHFGLATADSVNVVVTWLNDEKQTTVKLLPNQTITIKYSKKEQDALAADSSKNSKQQFKDITNQSGINFIHKENAFVDFDRDRLLYHMLSAEGPAFCTGDFNGDGKEDFYVGGAHLQGGELYFGQAGAKFRKSNQAVFAEDSKHEDVDCTCFDADNDGDIDLYVASGSNEFAANASPLIDRLYLNNGSGNFSKSNQILPSFKFQNSSVVTAADIDNDGDQDLFVGSRAIPKLIGVSADGFLLINDGNGKFKDQAKQLAPELKELGMITDASWTDADGDGDQDLLVVGEWMSISYFENQDGKLINQSVEKGLADTEGWWNMIQPIDLDNDGDTDFILGNHGNNSRFKASKEKPVTMVVNDFDRNGTAEPIISRYFGNESYPLVLKHDLAMQIPTLRKKYLKYEDFQNEAIDDIFPPEAMQNAITKNAYEMSSSVLINNGSSFTLQALPNEAQLTPIYAAASPKLHNDERLSLVLGGNFYYAKPEVGRYDAGYGIVLEQNQDKEFKFWHNGKFGLTLDKQVRHLKIIKEGNQEYLLVVNNNGPMHVFQINL
jgi:hypothetical protein